MAYFDRYNGAERILSGLGRIHYIGEEARQPKHPLTFGEVKRPARQLEIDIEQRSVRAFVKLLKCGGLSHPGRGHQHDETVIHLGSLLDAS